MLDDGTADDALRAALADPGARAGELARLLRSAPLLASVVAVLDEVDEHGGDKDSHMAVVSMVNDRGERGLLAFTGVDSLAAWNEQARPVPALGRDIARSALAEGAAAVIVDVVGPHRAVFSGIDLEVLADSLDLDAVVPAIRLAVGDQSLVIRDARLLDLGVDVIVETPEAQMARIASVIAADDGLRRLVPAGIAVVASGSISS